MQDQAAEQVILNVYEYFDNCDYFVIRLDYKMKNVVVKKNQFENKKKWNNVGYSFKSLRNLLIDDL